MALRFRRRIKLFPGLWLNVSKSGVSTSAGIKGVTVNLKDGETRTTVGLPGTGLSYRSTNATTPTLTGPTVRPLLWVLLALTLAGMVYAVSFL